MNWILYALLAYLCGALPFSIWLGKIFQGVDVRSIGDGNPGAINLIKSGGKITGVLAMLLDIAKAAAPVGIAYHNLGMRGVPMLVIAIAPVLGHAYSPFLGFRGGKAIAASFGVWIGLTLWKASLAGLVGVGIGLAFSFTSAWALMLGLAAILLALTAWMPDPLFLAVWLLMGLLLAWKHRVELRHSPRKHASGPTRMRQIR